MNELQHIRTALNRIWLVTLERPYPVAPDFIEIEFEHDFTEAERLCRDCAEPQRTALLFILSQVAVEIQRWADIKRNERHCYVCGHDFVAKVEPDRCPFCGDAGWIFPF